MFYTTALETVTVLLTERKQGPKVPPTARMDAVQDRVKSMLSGLHNYSSSVVLRHKSNTGTCSPGVLS